MRIMYYDAAATVYTVSWSDIIAADRDDDSDGKDNTSSVYFSACKLLVLECPCTRLVASYVQYGANECCYCTAVCLFVQRYKTLTPDV